MPSLSQKMITVIFPAEGTFNFFSEGESMFPNHASMFAFRDEVMCPCFIICDQTMQKIIPFCMIQYKILHTQTAYCPVFLLHCCNVSGHPPWRHVSVLPRLMDDSVDTYDKNFQTLRQFFDIDALISMAQSTALIYGSVTEVLVQSKCWSSSTLVLLVIFWHQSLTLCSAIVLPYLGSSFQWISAAFIPVNPKKYNTSLFHQHAHHLWSPAPPIKSTNLDIRYGQLYRSYRYLLCLHLFKKYFLHAQEINLTLIS